MYWSFSEYLNLIELRSQTWCVLELSETLGLQVPHSDGVLFYSVLSGSARLSCGRDEPVQLGAGDLAIVTSGEGHALRVRPDSAVSCVEFISGGEYVDKPLTIGLNVGPVAGEILCGRLKARWPGAKRPVGLPPVLTASAASCPVDIPKLLASARGHGGSAALTRMAMLVFVECFRSHPAGASIFKVSGLREPIAEAMRLMQTHPFQEWTVGRLARKVGMGRSNFATRFANDVGKPPMTLLIEERMKHASALLEQTDLKIADIAERIGYRSESAFSHRFAAYFGAAPGELRRGRRLAAPTLQA